MINNPAKQLTGLRIIFMGTPGFAVASLDALVNAGYNIVAVITAPDKEAGRGMQLQQSAVKEYAVEKGLTVLQPEKLKDPEFITKLKTFNADLQVVVAFRMLPEVVWDMPPMGTVNLHGSLLPQYRGAAPVNWAVINGEKETGVTTFKLKQEIDTGNILIQESFPIGENESAGDVHDKMKIIGAALLVKTVKRLAEGILDEKPQGAIVSREPSVVSEELSHESTFTPHYSALTTLKHAPKIFTETCMINWNKPVNEVHNLIRGLAPYPTAFTFLDNKKLKIFAAHIVVDLQSADGTGNNDNKTAGGILTDKKTYLHFTCSDGLIAIDELQLEGKKKMKVEDFLRGYRFLNKGS